MCQPYKHSTSGPPEASHPMEASHPSATGWHRGGLQGGPPEGLQRFASSETTLLYLALSVCHLMFHVTSSGLQQPT